ncbi:hypothetical protein PFISCL1PPCAC_8710, partial [Pristionchus fissidentatus]
LRRANRLSRAHQNYRRRKSRQNCLRRCPNDASRTVLQHDRCGILQRGSRWDYAEEDVHNGVHYRMNGVLGQLPDFKHTFGCYDDDLMTFPETSMCPAFSEKLS